MDDVTIANKTNRFYVAVCLLSSKSQMTSKCGKTRGAAECVTDLLPQFDVFCDLLLNRCTAT